MIDKIENWLLNVALGKFVARAVLVIVAYVGGPVFQGLAQKAGLDIQIDPVKLQAQLMAGLLALFEWFKAKRAANPASVTTQTNPALAVPPQP